MMNQSNKEKSPVVTIVVVTYNSAKYVLETLESIKTQTYPHLSLVITDDCSTDKTIELCKEWVSLNESRFVETQIIESSINTGISANGNRGVAACNTKWVKGIAGDDILMPNCISDNVEYIMAHPDTVYLFSKVKVFGGSKNRNIDVESYFNYNFFFWEPEQQLETLIFSGNCIPAVSLFYNLDIVSSKKLCNDERIPMLEDLPKWINALRNGIRFSFMDKETVLYRVHPSSVSTTLYASPRFYRSQRLFYYYYLRDEYIKRYGLEHVVQDDVNGQLEIYDKYIKYAFLPTSKIHFFLSHLPFLKK